MNQISAMLCPTPDQLIQLVSGSLSESDAEALFEHIDSCSSCQFQVDDLAKGKDLVLAAVKTQPRRHETPPTQDANLSALIQDAQKGTPRQDTRSMRDLSTRITSEADFVDNLRRSGLMSQDEIDQLLIDLSWDRNKSVSDSSSLAKQLISHRKLTKFQARLLIRGRWKGLVLGNYTILDKLGQGGMGSVFKARHSKMGRVVCLKVVNSAGRQSRDVIERFRNEARALAKLTHPNIVVAHDANETKGIPYLVMEFIDGADLSKRIKQDGPMSVDETLDVSIQVAKALDYAHSQGVIHRDVKPHNIVAEQDPDSRSTVVKVLDLGLARFDSLVTDNPDASLLAAMTNTGVVIGTVDYMSPEQALNSRRADGRSDIYSLGCTIYFLLIGRPPFEGETVMERLVAHREERPRSVCSFMKSDITPEFNAVVQKMLHKDPEDRYQSMAEVVADLQALKAGEAVSVPITHKSIPSSRSIPTPPPIASESLANVPRRQKLDSEDAVSAGDLNAQTSTLQDEAIESSRTLSPVHRRVLVAAGLLALCIVVPLAYVLGPANKPDEVVFPVTRVGADLAIANGGDGRALIILSSRKFNEDEFFAIRDAMDEQGVDIATASPNWGTSEPDYGKEIKAPFDNMNLDNVKPDEFDAVFVLGGDVWELTYKHKDNHEQMKRIIDGALASNIPLASCSNGCDPMFDGTKYGSKEYSHVAKKKTHSKEEFTQFAAEVFAKLKPSK